MTRIESRGISPDTAGAWKVAQSRVPMNGEATQPARSRRVTPEAHDTKGQMLQRLQGPQWVGWKDLRNTPYIRGIR